MLAGKVWIAFGHSSGLGSEWIVGRLVSVDRITNPAHSGEMQMALGLRSTHVEIGRDSRGTLESVHGDNRRPLSTRASLEARPGNAIPVSLGLTSTG